MANKEHLRLLRQDVDVWNKWRRENPGRVDLRGADLSETILSDTDLSEAWINRAILEDANLTRANLSWADLSEANLSWADLSEVNLNGAIPIRANLGEADLSGAYLSETIFANVDLSQAIGLDTCGRSGPSVIDHRTLARSGPLPISFLRGVGLPDNFIQYLPSLLNQPFQFYSCFISYSTKDQQFADRIHADLQNKGIRCWFARHDLPIGAKT